MPINLKTDKRGMALIAVMGIIVVVGILATSVFMFSSNELSFSRLDGDRAQAEYLARASVEIAAKSFPPVAGDFSSINATTGKPVSAKFILKKNSKGSLVIEGLKPDEAKPSYAIGEAVVTTTITQKDVFQPSETSPKTYDVWYYEATAVVNKSDAKVKGYTVPTAYAVEKSTSGTGNNSISQNLGWYTEGGQLKPEMSAYTAGAPITTGVLAGTTANTWRTSYNGVVRADLQGNTKLTIPTATTSNKNNFYGWGAQAISVEMPVDLRDQRSVSGIVISADTIVFEKQINLYCSRGQFYLGDVILMPLSTNRSTTVFFKDTVYFYHGNSRYKLFDGGDKFTFNSEVSLFTYAVQHDKLPTGFIGWIRQILGYDPTTGALTATTEQEPTKNSLNKVIWE